MYPDFPEPNAILDASVPTVEQVSTALTDPSEQWLTAFHRELRTLLDETDTPERDVALLSALAQLYCDATVVLITQQIKDR